MYACICECLLYGKKSFFFKIIKRGEFREHEEKNLMSNFGDIRTSYNDVYAVEYEIAHDVINMRPQYHNVNVYIYWHHVKKNETSTTYIYLWPDKRSHHAL